MWGMNNKNNSSECAIKNRNDMNDRSTRDINNMKKCDIIAKHKHSIINCVNYG